MHNFFAGFTALIMGVGSFFHMGQGLPAHQQNTQRVINATPSAFMERGFGRDDGENLPVGQRPFFGVVTAVNGSTLTVQIVTPGRQMMNLSITPTITPSVVPATPKTISIILDSNTKFVNGVQSDIKINTKIAGVGKVNSNGSLTATQVRINAQMPSAGMRNLDDQEKDASGKTFEKLESNENR
jgi:hypothetical protein